MSKINISLVGGQPFPVYAQILDNQPDIAILVCSRQTRKDAERIMAVLKKNLPKTGASLLEISAKDNAQANLSIKAQANVYCKPENEITINIAGGTKPWSLLFAKHFSGQAQLVYIDQNNIIWNMDTLEHHVLLPKGVSIDDLMALYGVRIHRKTSLSALTSDDLSLLPVIEEAREWNPHSFQELTSTPITHNFDTDEDLSWHKQDRTFTLTLLNRKRGYREFEFASPHVRDLLLNYGWFETKVALMLSQWPLSQKVWLNTEIALPEGQQVLNELDIIVETTTGKFLFVECKTKVSKPTDIDKFNDVVKKTGGTGAKRVFITEKPMDNLPAAKCLQTKMPHYDMQAITSSVNATKQFYAALDEYMGYINER